MDGTVVDALPNTQFKIKLDNGHELLAYTGGKMRKFRIRILLGDRVRVEMSPYDLTRGRIAAGPTISSPKPAAALLPLSEAPQTPVGPGDSSRAAENLTTLLSDYI